MKEFHSPLSAREANYFITDILISSISEMSTELQKLRFFTGRSMIHIELYKEIMDCMIYSPYFTEYISVQQSATC